MQLQLVCDELLRYAYVLTQGDVDGTLLHATVVASILVLGAIVIRLLASASEADGARPHRRPL